ncbi:hypothetical protein GIB67_040824 [Kingdonia uniflora]|uniref:Calmodulin-lysine N-methyltransferase n=1 Tax=Kingdonia uniflora TaxID=39325 RepID=A0A7J7P4I2_9MAGN|nr:hypothetical protein GIB67_040824 [Kingdonia uniflora]
METNKEKSSSLRWRILRNAFISTSLRPTDDSCESDKRRKISRKTSSQGFNLIKSTLTLINPVDVDDISKPDLDVYVSYTLPLEKDPQLVLRQRVDNKFNLNDFEICNRYDIDNTGLVCHWPSEDVLAYFCLSHKDMFRYKRVLELGAGYGLAGLVIAACTDALEVIISDGNPQVVDYIQHNIHANSGAFADTKVNSMLLHWNQDQDSRFFKSFDIIVASDCTFFKEFHVGLAQTIKSFLKHSDASEALFFSPKRGNSLDMFLKKIQEIGLNFAITENYDQEVWQRHEKFLNGDESWPNYEKDHCYPFLVRITS